MLSGENFISPVLGGFQLSAGEWGKEGSEKGYKPETRKDRK